LEDIGHGRGERSEMISVLHASINGRFHDFCCTAAKKSPYTQSNAASAKREKRMTAKSAHFPFADLKISQLQRMAGSTGRAAASRPESERQEWAVSVVPHQWR